MKKPNVRNTKCIKRNTFEKTLFVKYSKSFTTAKFQHNMVGVQFATEQRTFMVLEYNSTGFPERVIERFEERFPDRQPPCMYQDDSEEFCEVFDTWNQQKLKY